MSAAPDTVEAVYADLLARAPENRMEPRMEPMRRVLALLGDPQHAAPVIHLTGTNGKTTAVKDFNLHIQDKEFMVFVGPSGCGKSTTLRMIAGLEEISDGTLRIGDTLTEDEALNFVGVPYFAPEILRRVRLDDAMKAKKLRQALQELAEEGVVPGGTKSNLAHVAKKVRFPKGLPEVIQWVLADAQTNGGLLAAVPARDAAKALKALDRAQVDAYLIGEVGEAQGRTGIEVVG